MECFFVSSYTAQKLQFWPTMYYTQICYTTQILYTKMLTET